MSLNNMGLGFVFTARDIASKNFNRITKSFAALDQRIASGSESIKANLGRLKVLFGAFVVGAASLFGAFALANPAGKFDQAIAKVGAISKASAADLKMLEDAAIGAGTATKFSPTEAAEGLAELAAQGLNAQESMKALYPSLDLATGGQIEVADAASTMVAALKVFSIEADHAGVVTDKLLKVANVTALQARDLALAIGTVSRGATAAKQSIDEMLPSMGLVRNTGVDASVAASSVSSALVFMAQNASAFKKIGVSIEDAEGKFRPFMDVVHDTDKALAGLTDTKRVATATDLFGRFGLTAYSAISNQLGMGVKDATGKLVKGAQAVKFLRESMAAAGGTAAEFREKLLSNFEGQKTLFKGAMATLAIVVGQSFAQVLMPIMSALASMARGLITVIKAIPAPLRKFMAGVVVAAGAVLALVASGMLLKMVMGFVVVGVRAAVAAFMGLMATAWPVLLAIGLIIGAIVAVKVAVERNLLGMGDSFQRFWKKAKLAWQGITQLLQEGAFSGAVLDELDRVENSGVKQFAKEIYGIVYRIKRMFEGLAGAFMETVGPAMFELSKAFYFLKTAIAEVVEELGGPAAGAINTLATTGSDGFHSFGAAVGSVMGAVVTVIAKAVEWIAIIAGTIAVVVKQVIRAVKWVFDGLTTIGEGIGDWAYDMVESIKEAFHGAAHAIRGFFQPIIDFFDGVRDRIVSGILKLKDAMITVARKIPTWMRTEQMDRFAALDTQDEAANRVQRDTLIKELVTSVPAEEGIRLRNAEDDMKGAGLSDMMQRTLHFMQLLAEAQSRPVVVTINGEVVATAAQRADQDAADRGFSNVPMY